jgi:hypothetical protein
LFVNTFKSTCGDFGIEKKVEDCDNPRDGKTSEMANATNTSKSLRMLQSFSEAGHFGLGRKIPRALGLTWNWKASERPIVVTANPEAKYCCAKGARTVIDTGISNCTQQVLRPPCICTSTTDLSLLLMLAVILRTALLQ